MRGTEFIAEVLHKPPFSKMHPAMAAFFKDYLSHEKVVEFEGMHVLNTHFPPFPSRAFERMAAQFNTIGTATERSLYSVTLAVTNRCPYACWHCYNAGRNQHDLSEPELLDIVRQLRELKTVHVTLTGGEPLLREELERIAQSFGDQTYLSLNTTGWGLSLERACRLKESGLFALGVSLDSSDPAEHDEMRGNRGAFEVALKALDHAGRAGLYPYVITVGTHGLLQRERFMAFMQFVAAHGAREIHLLEPCATGRLAGRQEVLLSAEERGWILDMQHEAAMREDLPILSTFLHLEGPGAFGCGAGLTHLYIDGSGEVSPCNLLPLSFGNMVREPLSVILDRMGECFREPRTCCVGQVLAEHIPDEPLPLSLDASKALCDKHLPRSHAVPRFFRVRHASNASVGAEELKSAYNHIHGSYDDFWLSEARLPIHDLVDCVPFRDHMRVFEAGCGTGYATALIADHIKPHGEIWAADLSDGMLAEARARIQSMGIENVRFMAGDALGFLEPTAGFDVVFSSWVLGYIPLAPFFKRARRALAPGGRIAIVVHKDHSPREPLEIFEELVMEDPSVLLKRVAFDFPRDRAHLEQILSESGLTMDQIREGGVVFQYDTPEQVLEHLLKSGAGTAFHDAIDPARRDTLEKHFLDRLRLRNGAKGAYAVTHDYIACVAREA